MDSSPGRHRTSSGARIGAIDAARGSAMVMVCASHIKDHVDVSSPALFVFLQTVTRIATPTFLLISGFVIGYLLTTRRRRSDNMGITLIDRALFLLIVAHALLGLADLSSLGHVQWMLGRSQLTDAIAVALILAVAMRSLPSSTFAVLGISLCVLSWGMVTMLGVEDPLARRLTAMLFAMYGSEQQWAHLPLVPYIGMFLIGMSLGRQLTPAVTGGDTQLLVRRLRLLGVGAMALASAGSLAWHFGDTHLPALLREPEIYSLLSRTLNPAVRQPPGPAYMLFYGGAGLLLLSAFFRARPVRLMRPLTRVTAIIGTASLMCYVVQDWLLFVVPRLLHFEHFESPGFWLSYLAGCLMLLYALSRRWRRHRANRYLTVGLKTLAASPDRLREAFDPRSARQA